MATSGGAARKQLQQKAAESSTRTDQTILTRFRTRSTTTKAKAKKTRTESSPSTTRTRGTRTPSRASKTSRPATRTTRPTARDTPTYHNQADSHYYKDQWNENTHESFESQQTNKNNPADCRGLSYHNQAPLRSGYPGAKPDRSGARSHGTRAPPRGERRDHALPLPPPLRAPARGPGRDQRHRPQQCRAHGHPGRRVTGMRQRGKGTQRQMSHSMPYSRARSSFGTVHGSGGHPTGQKNTSAGEHKSG